MDSRITSMFYKSY